MLNVKDHGVIGDGVTDDTSAIQYILDNLYQEEIYFPPSEYLISDVLTSTHDNVSIRGAGRCTSTLISNNPDKACLSFVNSRYVTLSSIGAKHNVATNPIGNNGGGNGIEFLGVNEFCDIRYIKASNNNIGLVFQGTHYSTIDQVLSEGNASQGIQFSNSETAISPCQWVVSNVLSQANGHHGVAVYMLPDTVSSPQLSLGSWTNINTFANTGSGICLYSFTGKSIHGFRLRNSFLGEDGNHGLNIIAPGNAHLIASNYFEIAGTGYTGPTLSTPPSGVGYGVVLSAGVNLALVTGNIFSSNSSGNAYNQGSGNVFSNNHVI